MEKVGAKNQRCQLVDLICMFMPQSKINHHKRFCPFSNLTYNDQKQLISFIDPQFVGIIPNAYDE